jgi:hypothetical protein
MPFPIQQLIQWAASSIGGSLNQPTLPHAIIVLNSVDSDSDPKYWNVESATEHLLASVPERWLRILVSESMQNIGKRKAEQFSQNNSSCFATTRQSAL